MLHAHGPPVFRRAPIERELLASVHSAAEASGFWQKLETDSLCLDCELMPWPAKAQELSRSQYAPAGGRFTSRFAGSSGDAPARPNSEIKTLLFRSANVPNWRTSRRFLSALRPDCKNA
jgi:hypothetical protein